MSKNQKLFKSARIVGGFTLISRILGYVRDIVIARYFGTATIAAQAFIVAFRIPNTLRHLVGEGAANAAVIPILSEYLGEDKKKEFWHITNIMLNLIIIILAIITIIGTLLAPLIVRIIAFGFVHDPAKLELTIYLTRIMFSFIFFIGIAAYGMGVLNTLKNFAVAAAGSCFLNITMIIFGVWVCQRFEQPVVGLALAVLIGGVLQILVQIPIMLKKGFYFEWAFDFSHPAIKKMGRLLLPRMLGSSIYQLNAFLDTFFASFSNIVGQGAIGALYFSNRLIQFPTALFGSALATACLPTMSRQAIKNDIVGLKNTLTVSLKTLLVFLIPSTVGLLVLAKPIVEILFERGEFDELSTQITAAALMYYCLGIFFYSAARVLTSCFYALKDTRTPVKATFFCLLLNGVLNFILMRWLKVGGIALATSISSAVNFFLLLYLLRQKIGIIGFAKVMKMFYAIILASIVMGAGCFYAYDYCHKLMAGWQALAAAVITAMLVYLIMGWSLKIFKGFKVNLE
ncbi:MAG: murein biosynthesis integral membrane protein MurJ [Candidatus Omnitrophica bacterium]|nr:murein biosynthesis integral membrane protein MurJ [Candidatus Omnitrophota bacterium]